ncbi:unnamed protein product [Didymodactylos carnosus]|uniref:Uncharacterized protein n=1 Tax=Didymodactylos carnosus TaxID=1234261 RepID=A0A814MIE2_9BILA|nr:unnamed protein product [Didymodactylos carnosus]CAF1303827.1 unnamed protein product [Didymodactylos carnosus]CAF3845476.1 unnamed protein product [Didymodactylos carnosus]CAF4110633.1 unnamed protein product [Didymodactylos carnosus]
MQQFAKLTKLAYFLLNTSKDNSSLSILACLQTLAKLQNNLINYYKQVTNPHSLNNDNETQQLAIPIQKLKQEHLLVLNTDTIDHILNNENGFIINYEYGKTKEIIFDYDEIETKLRNRISRIRSIDINKFDYFNYQFELYNQDVSLFTDIRRNIKQELLPNDDKIKYRQFLMNTKPDDIRKFLGSLDYVFTYLRNSSDQPRTLTIRNFVQKAIQNKDHLHPFISNQQQPFANLQLKFVINLYEVIEELVFDEIMKNYVKQELSVEACSSDEEKSNIIEQFIRSTYMLENMPQPMKNPNVWMSVLKRLIIPVVTSNIDLTIPLQIYIERTDLWNEDLIEYLDYITIQPNILLRHTYIILNGIETKLAAIQNKTIVVNEQKYIRDWCQTKNEKFHASATATTATTTAAGATTTTNNRAPSKTKKPSKLRVD